ncbi:MAG: hypothetical protein HY420_04620 [Candidatus Kerfeldbacteria bacterium]|nr:hypothetical protein [Candidatus Kerfeldbacteria bacterium]
MTKQFAMIVGWVLILVGILNFFVTKPESIAVTSSHAVFHIVAGLLGVILPKSHKGYTLWVGIVGVLLAIVGFAGVTQITSLINLPTGFNYIHAILGVVGLLVYFGARGDKSMSSGVAGQGNMGKPA